MPPSSNIASLLAVGWTSSGASHEALVSNLLRDGRLTSPVVAAALRATDRAHFVLQRDQAHAYEDRPLPIGYEATISAPHMHAHALQLLEPQLRPGATVLDVGCGTGVLTAAFAHMVGPSGRVHGVDYIDPLVRMSEENLVRHEKAGGHALLASGRVTLSVGDGWQGVPEHAPFDAIHVGAAAEEIPQKLVEQLRPGGRMIVPVGPRDGEQHLMQVDKSTEGKVRASSLMGVRYVPLVRQPAPRAEL